LIYQTVNDENIKEGIVVIKSPQKVAIGLTQKERPYMSIVDIALPGKMINSLNSSSYPVTASYVIGNITAKRKAKELFFYSLKQTGGYFVRIRKNACYVRP